MRIAVSATVCETRSKVPDLPEDLEDLINLRITREQWLSHRHLRKDTSDGPHIDSGAVMTRTEKNFWSSVPEGDDLKRV